MEMLFIGGPKDEERIEVREDKWSFVIPINVSKAVLYPQRPEMKFEHHHYERHLLRGLNREFNVFVSTTISIDDAMQALIDNYRPEKGTA